MLSKIWRKFKMHRKIKFGPLALAFKFERSTKITNHLRSKWKLSSVQHQEWIESKKAALPNKIAEKISNVDSKMSERDDHEFALIVGVGPGFGYALARKLASEGIAVILVSRNAQLLEDLVEEIIKNGGFACAYGCDATSETSVIELFSVIANAHGVPCLVVYSLQNFGPGAVVDIELPAFEEGWKQNCLGSFLVARSAARLMSPIGRGSIILIGSTSSIIGREGHLNLAVGKFGQRALSQVLARELWHLGIHVAHLMIDADISEVATKDQIGTSSVPDHIAETVLSVHRQPKTAWTSEIDIRPWNERFWEHC